MFEIRQAAPEEYDSVRAFYHSMIHALEGARYTSGWKIDIYPSPEFLQESLAAGELYVGELDGVEAASMVLNHKCNDGYNEIDWPTLAGPDECLLIHALGVHPDYEKHGLAHQMARKAIATARSQSMKIMRLDVLAGNIPAEKLYESLGFRRIQTVSMYYPDTGWADYEGYELVL